MVYWTFVFGGLGSLFLLDAGEMRTVFADGRMVLVALGLIVISTVLPYLLYTNGLARVESGKASILASLEPVVASFVGILAFGEPVSLMVFLGLGVHPRLRVCIVVNGYGEGKKKQDECFDRKRGRIFCRGGAFAARCCRGPHNGRDRCF